MELCWETRELPDVERLRLRIMRKVMEFGLTGFTEDCVDVLQQAVEDHLKNLLANHIQKVKLYRTHEHIRYSGFVAESAAGSSSTTLLRARPDPAVTGDAARPPYRHVIRLREFAATVEMAPHLLGEQRSQLDKWAATL